MKYIANILTRNKFKDGELYNIVSSKSNLIPGIPTLVINWNFAKECYPNIDILNWKVNDMLYWTFGNRERRQHYDENVIKFRDKALEILKNTIKYQYFNILTATDLEKKQMLDSYMSDTRITSYISNDMLYSYNPDTNIVTGISLRDIKYSGKDITNIMLLIRNYNNILIDNINNLSFSIKEWLSTNNYIIPYLYS